MGAIGRDTLPAASFERQRARLLTTDAFQQQDPHERARALAALALTGGDPARPPDRAAALAKLAPADLQALAARLLVDDARTQLRIVSTGGSR